MPRKPVPRVCNLCGNEKPKFKHHCRCQPAKLYVQRYCLCGTALPLGQCAIRKCAQCLTLCPCCNVNPKAVTHAGQFGSYCRDCVNARNRKWCKANPVYGRQKRSRRRAVLKAAKVGSVDYGLVIQQAEGICAHCNTYIPDLPKMRHVDHIVPLARGGSHTQDNLQLLCQLCNDKKRCRLESELTPKNRPKSYHPDKPALINLDWVQAWSS